MLKLFQREKSKMIQGWGVVKNSKIILDSSSKLDKSLACQTLY